MSAVIPSVNFSLSKDVWVKQGEPDEINRAVYATLNPGSDESLIVLKASCEALDGLKKYKNKTTAAFEKAIKKVLDDLQESRNEVFNAVLNFRDDVDYFYHFVKNQSEIFGRAQKLRANATSAGLKLELGNRTDADFRQFYDKVGATLQKTHDKALPIFQKFHKEVMHALRENYDGAISTLPMIDNEGVFLGKKINKFATACQITWDKAVTTNEISCKALHALKKSQDEITASFKKIQGLSISIHKATNEARVAGLKSTNESTIKAALNKVKPEVDGSRDVQDKLLADLWRCDGVLASFLKIQDEVIAATESLKDQIEASASLLEVEDETAPLLS